MSDLCCARWFTQWQERVYQHRGGYDALQQSLLQRRYESKADAFELLFTGKQPD